MPTPPCPSAPNRQRGSSATEFILAAVPILLVGLGAIELSRWFFIKQALSLALLEAGRAGIVHHARPASIETAFERALLPLFPPTSTHSAAQRLRNAFERRQAHTGVPPWQIRVLAPEAAAFHDFSAAGLAVAGADGLAVIDNHYLAEQHERYQARGWPGGRGPLSGVTIFEANDLALHLTYMHEPLVPGMASLLRLLSPGSAGYARQALAGGYLPLQQTLRLTMQSHPVAWPRSSDKVMPAGAPAQPATQAMPPGATCRGIWCDSQNPSPPAPASPPASPPGSAFPGSSGAGLPGGSPPSTQPVTPRPPAADGPGPPEAGDLACGIVVCCIQG